MLADLFPFILSSVTIAFAVAVVSAKSPIHSVLYLILTFFCIASHYVLLNAQFLAVVHIIVYAGAIMVLFLFVIMLMNLNAESEPKQPWLIRFAAVFAGGIFFLTLTAALRTASDTALIGTETDIGLIKNLGLVLFNQYALPFEASGVLFITAMAGAVVLGKKAGGTR
jgi:NADH-quinone oxidoreductase subunit J